MKLIAVDNQRAHRRLPACAHDHDDGRLVGRHVESSPQLAHCHLPSTRRTKWVTVANGQVTASCPGDTAVSGGPPGQPTMPPKSALPARHGFQPPVD